MTYVTIPGWGEMDVEYLVEEIRALKLRGDWTMKEWKAVPALNEKNGRTSAKYNGQNFDPKYFDFIEDGWTHDHCQICSKTISDNPGNSDWATRGHTNGNDWICEQCYSLFMTTND